MDRPGINWRHFDFYLLGAVAILAIFGIVMIRSAIAGNIELLELDLVNRQIIFFTGGLAVIFITTAIDYHLWSAISRPMYIGMAALLAILFIVGAALFGSARWFDTGVILIQPSELAKIVVVLVLADFFTQNQAKIHDLRTVARSFIWVSGIVIWILLQPNLSTSIVIFVMAS
jgi:rod shape determining protein RodA